MLQLKKTHLVCKPNVVLLYETVAIMIAIYYYYYYNYLCIVSHVFNYVFAFASPTVVPRYTHSLSNNQSVLI